MDYCSTQLVLLECTLLSIGLFAAGDTAYSNGNFDSALIEVNGNERTRTVYIEKLTQNCLEDHIDFEHESSVKEELSQCVMNSRLFSKVYVHEIENGFRIEVEEKWTLIPIPFVQVGSGDERNYGVFLLESNFLGLGKLLALGGNMSNRGSGYFFFLSDRAVALSNFSAGISAMKSQLDFEHLDGGVDNVLEGFTEHRTSGGIRGGYSQGPYSFDVGIDRRKLIYQRLDDWELPLDYAATALNIKGRLNLSDYQLYIDKGLRLDLSLSKDISRNGSENGVRLPSTYLATATSGIPIWFGHAMLVRGTIGFVEGGSIGDLLRVGGTPGYRGIILRSALAEKHASIAVDYLTPFHKAKYGTWTAGVFGDRGKLNRRDFEDNRVDWSSYGVGTYLFLKGVAIPGIGFEVGMNSRFEGSFANFTLGLAI